MSLVVRPALVQDVDRVGSELRGVCAEAEKLGKRHSFSRIVHSSSDAKAVTDMKDRIATARQNFQVRCLLVCQYIDLTLGLEYSLREVYVRRL